MLSTGAHYEAHSAKTYESAFFYEPGAYQQHLKSLVQSYLSIGGSGDKERLLLDIGGGTGNFTRKIVEDTNVRAVIIDPFLEQSEDPESNSDEQVSFVKASAEDFSSEHDHWWRANYQQILMKEVVHHFDSNKRLEIFQGMYNGIVPNQTRPSILVITRPQVDIDYPLWDAARDVWARNQPSLEELVADLEKAGFRNIQHSVEPYPCEIQLERWLSMIKGKFWSTFSNFTDDELERACIEIETRERDRTKNGVLNFEDRLLFILADK